MGIKNFVLYGSNDDAAWTALVTSSYTGSDTWQDFTIADTTAYRYWKLESLPAGRYSQAVLFEWQIPTPEGATPNMTLVSAAATATAAPTDARLCVLYKDDSGTVVLDTDVTFEVSRDGGTTWTAVTMVDAGDYDGTYRKLIGHVDISDQPSGTSMKWRIRTLNNKPQRVRGVAHMWG